jgi:hypothetical protein
LLGISNASISSFNLGVGFFMPLRRFSKRDIRLGGLGVSFGCMDVHFQKIVAAGGNSVKVAGRHFEESGRIERRAGRGDLMPRWPALGSSSTTVAGIASRG